MQDEKDINDNLIDDEESELVVDKFESDISNNEETISTNIDENESIKDNEDDESVEDIKVIEAVNKSEEKEDILEKELVKVEETDKEDVIKEFNKESINDDNISENDNIDDEFNKYNFESDKQPYIINDNEDIKEEVEKKDANNEKINTESNYYDEKLINNSVSYEHDSINESDDNIDLSGTYTKEVEVLEEKNNKLTNDNSNNVKNVHGGKNMSGKRITIFALGAVMSAAVLVFAAIGVISLIDNGSNSSKANDSNVSITVPPSSDDESNTADISTTANSEGNIQNAATTEGTTSVADVVENAIPSIVAVNCTVTSTTMDMFGQNYSQDAESSGSGIIIGQNSNKTQLLIATNNHVVEDAKTVEIVFCDDETVSATVKGTDSSADLAVIAVNISDMKDKTKETVRIATIGDSSNAKVGETAIAIGNALGYGQSVTVGIISALEREVSVEDCTMNLIQTDAAINPGNSGGALINSKGELIGINSVKYVSEDTEGIGYAIPISTAVPIINELMNYEEIPDEEQGYLGIIGVSISSSFSLRNDIEGVVIKEVSDNSPASKGGLVTNDVIVKFAGRDITSMEEIQSILQKKKGGDEVEIVIKRLDKGEYVEKKLKVTLGSRGDYTK